MPHIHCPKALARRASAQTSTAAMSIKIANTKKTNHQALPW